MAKIALEKIGVLGESVLIITTCPCLQLWREQAFGRRILDKTSPTWDASHLARFLDSPVIKALENIDDFDLLFWQGHEHYDLVRTQYCETLSRSSTENEELSTNAENERKRNRSDISTDYTTPDRHLKFGPKVARRLSPPQDTRKRKRNE